METTISLCLSSVSLGHVPKRQEATVASRPTSCWTTTITCPPTCPDQSQARMHSIAKVLGHLAPQCRVHRGHGPRLQRLPCSSLVGPTPASTSGHAHLKDRTPSTPSLTSVEVPVHRHISDPHAIILLTGAQATRARWSRTLPTSRIEISADDPLEHVSGMFVRELTGRPRSTSLATTIAASATRSGGKSNSSSRALKQNFNASRVSSARRRTRYAIQI